MPTKPPVSPRALASGKLKPGGIWAGSDLAKIAESALLALTRDFQPTSVASTITVTITDNIPNTNCFMQNISSADKEIHHKQSAAPTKILGSSCRKCQDCINPASHDWLHNTSRLASRAGYVTIPTVNIDLNLSDQSLAKARPELGIVWNHLYCCDSSILSAS